MNATDTDTGDRLARTLNPVIALRRVELGTDSDHDRAIVREHYGTAVLVGTVRDAATAHLSPATGADAAADAAAVARYGRTFSANLHRGARGTYDLSRVIVPTDSPMPTGAGITFSAKVYA